MSWPHKYSSPHGRAPAHTIASAPLSHQVVSRKHHLMEFALFIWHCVGTPRSWTLPRERFLADSKQLLLSSPPSSTEQLMAHFLRHSQAHRVLALSIKRVSFFPEKEIDRNWFENVKPYQRPTVTPRQIFSGWCKCLISPRLFSQLTVWGVKPQINPQIFSGGRLEREVA